MTAPVPKESRHKASKFAVAAANLLADRHCSNVLLLDVRGLSQVCDFVLIGTGTSARQMKSVAGELSELGEPFKETVFRTSRDDGSTWIVIDFVDLVVHLFEPDQREYYDLEDLWSDAEKVEWRRPAGKPGGRSAAAPAPGKAAGRRKAAKKAPRRDRPAKPRKKATGDPDAE